MSELSFNGVDFAYRRAGFSGGTPVPVFSRFSWSMPPGKTVLLGPNGAGKTTLLSLGATALMPGAGSITLGDLDASKRRDRARFRRIVGWMPQTVRPIPGLTAREQIAYAGWLKGMSRGAAWAASIDALERVDLDAEADRLTAQLSGGQQRRVGLAQLLVHSAGVLLLDEPSVGLDPAQRARFRELIRDAGQQVPVLVSTHQVDDLSDVFDTVVVLDRGKVRFQGTVADFMALAPSANGHQAEAAYATLIEHER